MIVISEIKEAIVSQTFKHETIFISPSFFLLVKLKKQMYLVILSHRVLAEEPNLNLKLKKKNSLDVKEMSFIHFHQFSRM